MNYILVVSMIAVFLIGFIFIDDIYKIADPIEFAEDASYQPCYDNKLTQALIYGDSDFCIDISQNLQQHNICSEILYDINQLDKSCPYKFLIAASKSDLDNLTICAIGLKMMGINKILAVCNQQYNRKIYEENHILYLSADNLLASDIALKLLNIREK